MIQLRRVYQPPLAREGERFLVERLWPRGLRKDDLPAHVWQKEAAPSAALRQWFSHDPAKWERFEQKYFAELDAHPDTWAPIAASARRGTVTLLYSSRDEQHNNALALKLYLEKKVHRR